MRYILEPLNESQDMNCRVEFTGSRTAAAKKAVGIAAALQACLDGTRISCRVGGGDEDGALFVAFPSGELVDTDTGNVVRMER